MPASRTRHLRLAAAVLPILALTLLLAGCPKRPAMTAATPPPPVPPPAVAPPTPAAPPPIAPAPVGPATLHAGATAGAVPEPARPLAYQGKRGPHPRPNPVLAPSDPFGTPGWRGRPHSLPGAQGRGGGGHRGGAPAHADGARAADAA